MKKYAVLFAFLLLPVAALFAQDDQPETLFSGISDVDGFGAFMMEWGQVGEELTYSRTWGGGVMLDNRFLLGAYTTKLKSNVQESFDNQTLNLDFNHSGFWLGYYANASKRIHAGLTSRLGWGDVDWEDTGDNEVVKDDVFIVAPQLELQGNLTRFLKLSVAGGYRLATGYNVTENMNKDALNGPFGSITLKLGAF